MNKQNLFLNNRTPLKEITPVLLQWYAHNARILPWRKNTDPYRVWVSEIMLQQTRVDTVIPYYERFLQILPDIRALAQVPEEELLKLWEGLGYYSRVRNMQRAAQIICRDRNGIFPDRVEQISTLPGIGPYTAGAIGSIAFEQATPAVDGNVLRVISRLCKNGSDIADAAYKKQVTAALAAIYPETGRGAFTQSLMELGAIVCLPNGAPLCEKCPLRFLCAANADGTQLDFPVQAAKPQRKIQELTVFVLRCENRIAVEKRPVGGLLGGLWQLPNTEEKLTTESAILWLKDRGISVSDCKKAVDRKHIFTHIEWRMSCYEVRCADCDGGFIWANEKQLETEITLPTAFKKILPRR